MSNSKERPLKVALVLAVVAVAALAFAGMATAAFTENPSINSSSAISDGATISVYDASADNSSTLIVNTNNSDTIDSVDAELSPADRNFTVYSADDTSDDYSVETGVNSGSDDAHTFNISHDELADVPVSANGSTDVHFNVTLTDDAGDTYEVNGTFTVNQANHERSVEVIDPDALNGGVSGLSVSEETDHGITEYWGDGTSVYDAESENRAIDGSNTTVYVYMQDSGVADEFDSAADSGVLSGSKLGAIRGYSSNVAPSESVANTLAPDASASSGDRIFEMTATTDSGENGDEQAIPVFYESADSSIVDNETDTYAVYDADENVVRFEPGTDAYGNATSMDVRTATKDPEDVLSRDSFASTMTADLGFWSQMEAFGAAEASGLAGVSLMIGIPLIGGIRRRNGAAA